MISVITINKNNCGGLQNTLKSVACQNYPDFELIVIDGDSNDGSKSLLSEYKNTIRIGISEPDKGIYDAMNKGIKHSTGNYLLFLNSGDTLLDPGVLARMAPHLKECDVISANIVIEDKNGQKHRCFSYTDIDLEFFLEKSLYHQSTFISSEAFKKYGLYNSEFKLSGDYELFIRLFFKYNASYCYVNEFVACFKEDGISNNNAFNQLKKTEWEQAWGLNVSQRTLALLRQGQDFKNSTTYWIYNKTLSPGIYRSVFSFVYSLRRKMYRMLNTKKQ